MTVSFLARDIRLFSLLYKFSGFGEPPDFRLFSSALAPCFCTVVRWNSGERYTGRLGDFYSKAVVRHFSLYYVFGTLFRFGTNFFPSTVYLERFFNLSQIFSSYYLLLTDFRFGTNFFLPLSIPDYFSICPRKNFSK